MGIFAVVRRAAKKRKRAFLQTGVTHLRAEGQEIRGRALLAYRLHAFLSDGDSELFSAHTMYTESLLIAEVLLRLGYEVDVIDFENQVFVPSERYDVLISTRKHFQRYAEMVNGDCVKIAHLDTSHWMHNNAAALGRCCGVQRKRGASLRSYRLVEENTAIENADYGILLGNHVSAETYAFSRKQIFTVPVPVARLYPEPKKDYEAVRKTFLWLGSLGFVHKGLDLVLEAFAEMPEYRLVVCGPVNEDREFEQAYYKELYERSNIFTHGWIDVASEEFMSIANASLALIYPSCAEGQSGGAATCMHAGVIPILSRQTGLDLTPGCGLLLNELSVAEVQAQVKAISELSGERLREMALNAWSCARRDHTRENYLKRYTTIIREILIKEGASAPEEWPRAGEANGARAFRPRARRWSRSRMGGAFSFSPRSRGTESR